jgi:hypothetical protein
MENSGTDVSEDRIAALEKKLPEMEALVKGLIAELLDIRSVTRTISRQDEERRRQELMGGADVQGTISPALTAPIISSSGAANADGSTVIRPKGVQSPDCPVAPAEPVMVRIMQSDGTMKLEPRYGETNHIDSTGGYGRTRKGASVNSRQNPLIYAAGNDKQGNAKK